MNIVTNRLLEMFDMDDNNAIYIDIHTLDMTERVSCFVNNALIDETPCEAVELPKGIVEALKGFITRTDA